MSVVLPRSVPRIFLGLEGQVPGCHPNPSAWLGLRVGFGHTERSLRGATGAYEQRLNRVRRR